jgi:hypothetical protein
MTLCQAPGGDRKIVIWRAWVTVGLVAGSCIQLGMLGIGPGWDLLLVVFALLKSIDLNPL